MKQKLTPTRVIALGFVGVILMGALLLMLPISAKSGHVTPFVDAFFTATSATCVTGLVVYDTFLHWTLFGQLVILLLIQIGGLGFVSFTITLFMLLNKRIGLKNRNLMQEAVSAPQLGGIIRLTRFILFGTFAIELTGAILLSFVFVPRLGFWRGVYYGIFHSISAFCNAGFDLLGIFQENSSLGTFSGNWFFCTVIMLLIIIGGLGFFVWDDLRHKKFAYHRYLLHTKVVLVTTLFLIVVPFLLILIPECQPGGAFAREGFSKAALMSLFQTVTTRTAGFATMDLNLLRDSSILLMMILMLIGGSPGSTAGGLKTTTFAVLIMSTVSFIRRKDATECHHRRLEPSALRRAVTLFVILVGCVIACTYLIIWADDVSMRDAAFEAISAIATVGLTMGITPSLSVISKLALALLMFIGRVGCLTLLFAVRVRPNLHSNYAVDQLTVG